jgi:hypothetical protein
MKKTISPPHSLNKTKLFKRLLVYLLCVTLLSSAFILSVYAMNTATLSIGQVVGKPGDTVTVNISLDSNPGIAGLGIQVTYDETRLRINSQSAINRGLSLAFLSYVGVNENTYSKSPFSVLWFGAMNDTSTGTLLSVTFTVQDNAPEGLAYVNVIYRQGDAVNLNEEHIPLSIAQGGVIVSRNDNSGSQNPLPTPSPNPATPPGSAATGGATPGGVPQTPQTSDEENLLPETPPSASNSYVQYVDTESLPSNFQHPAMEHRIFTVTGEQDGKETVISMPYTANNVKVPESLVVYRIEQDGSIEIIKTSRYDSQKGIVEFVGTNGGLYFIGANHVEFLDVTSDAWYYEAVTFVAARKIFVGIGENRFAPDTTMSRGMFITALANLDGADTTIYKDSPFLDADIEAWYGAPIAWAKDIGIVSEGILSGCEQGSFNPEDSITREQMAVIFANYISIKGLILPERSVEIFSDIEQANDWAQDAIQVMRRHSIVDGVGENRYNPKSTATRAEVAQIFRNLINAIIG